MLHGSVSCTSWQRIYGFTEFGVETIKGSGGGAALILIFFSALSVLIMLQKAIHTGVRADWSTLMFFVSDSNKLLALMVSVSTFMFFKNIHIRQSRLINTIASCTFGILLIHANSDAMRQWLWKETCNNAGMFHSSMIYIHALCVPVAVFIVCAGIDYCRQQFLERPYLDKIVKLIRRNRLYVTIYSRLHEHG